MSEKGLNPNARSFVPNFNGQQNTKNSLRNQIEARCEQVVEILNEATEMCDQMNNNNNNLNGEKNLNDEQAQLNDDELFEMMQMQEECRMEMMKYYIQAQNPNLFEEVYYGVTYPDHVQQPAQRHSDTKILNDMSNLNLNENHTSSHNNQLDETIQFLKTNLNPDASEFKPKTYQ